MRVLFLCVNYHSYRELAVFRESVEQALACASDSVEAELHIADNTDTEFEEISPADGSRWRVRSYPLHRNIGYLPALEYLMSQSPGLREGMFDFVIFSNVDVQVAKDFFTRLAAVSLPPDTGWIAPAIESEYEGRDRNPGMIRRPTRCRLELCRIMFRFPFLYRWYHHRVYLRSCSSGKAAADIIYAGHGSFMIFTRAFMMNYPAISYPAFLFCEEIFMAELLRRCGLKCVYRPEIRITDLDHVSTSKMDSGTYFRARRQSLGAVIGMFFRLFRKVRP